MHHDHDDLIFSLPVPVSLVISIALLSERQNWISNSSNHNPNNTIYILHTIHFAQTDDSITSVEY